MSSAPDKILQPHLGWFSATTIVVGSMIGSAIFFAPSIMANQVGAPGLLIGLWIVGGIFTLLGAISTAELAAMVPHAGGQYVFLREAFGRIWGFLYGWTLFLVIQTGFNAAVSIAFAKYLGVILPEMISNFPEISERNILFEIPLWQNLPEAWPAFLRDFRVNSAQIVACGVIVFLTAINLLGVRAGTWLQNIFTVLKVSALLALVIAAFAMGEVKTSTFLPLLPDRELLGVGVLAGLAQALSKALFAYDAWNTATFVAEEVKNPDKNLPRALILGTLGVMVIYVLTNIAYLSVVPLEEMPNAVENRIAQVAAERLFGPVGTNLVIVAILISTFGCVNGLILSGARVFFAMAREQLFFPSCARLILNTGVPAMALVYQGFWSCVLTLTGSYGMLLTYTTFASVFFGALTVVGVLVLRQTQPNRPRPYRCWGYPLTPALYLLFAGPFLVYLILSDPTSTGLGFVLVLTGLPVYWIINKANTSNAIDTHITQ